MLSGKLLGSIIWMKVSQSWFIANAVRKISIFIFFVMMFCVVQIRMFYSQTSADSINQFPDSLDSKSQGGFNYPTYTSRHRKEASAKCFLMKHSD